MNLGRYIVLPYAIVSLVLAGCASPRSFLGSSFPPVTYKDIKKRDVPLRLKLVVEFQRNGVRFPMGEVPLRDYSGRILRDTGVIYPVDELSLGPEQEDGEIRIVLNNVADSGTVAVEASPTGFPLWMVGKLITDAYEMSMSISVNGKTLNRTNIQHAVHTAIGNMSIPGDVQVFPADQAFGKVLEQMILRALEDFQSRGELVWRGLPPVDWGSAGTPISSSASKCWGSCFIPGYVADFTPNWVLVIDDLAYPFSARRNASF
ncbi:MAG: hypothetical protein ABI284_04890 [Nitrosospira sp.]